MPLPTPYRKPPGRAIVDPFDFGVDPDALMDEDVRDELVATLAAMPPATLYAVRLIAAAPTSERLKILAEADEAVRLVNLRPPLRRAV